MHEIFFEQTNAPQTHNLQMKVICLIKLVSQIIQTKCRGPWWYSGNTLPSTSEVPSSNPRPYVGKLVVAYRWSTVYGTAP